VADERRVVISSEPYLTPEEVGRRTFATVFRGFDPVEVRAYLRRVSDELGVARERQRHVEHLLAEAQNRTPAPPAPLDEHALTAALGEETARVLQTAREAATDIKGKAQEHVERLLRQAHEDAARIRKEAEGIFATRDAEATEAAEGIKTGARTEAEAVLGRATAEGTAIVDEAREQARQMLEEAKEIRAKVLGDVVRKRNVARVQVAQLRAGRERLLDAYRVVRETLDDVTVELGRAEDEARLAAEVAGQKAGTELAGDEGGEQAAELDPELLGEPVAVDLAAHEPDPALAAAPVEGEAEEEVSQGEADAHVVAEAGPPVVDDAPPVAEAAVEAVEPEATPEPESETAPEPEPEDQLREDELPEAPLDIVEPPADIEAVRIIVPTDTDEGAADAEPEPVAERPHRKPVDALFARLRAGRAEAVAEAQQVLADATTAESAPANGNAPANGTAPTVTVEDPADELLRRRDSELEPIEAQLAKKLKRAMQDEQNDVLDRLRVHRGRPALADALPAATAQGARYRDAALPLLQQAARAGADSAGSADAPVDLATLVSDLAEAVTGPLRTRLDESFSAGEREDDDDAATVERVGAAYREWKMQRIEHLAGDHLAAAYALGVLGATASGAALRWIVSDLDGPCPDCDDNALAGPTPKGEAFPTGQLHPPAHAGCRCLLVPVPT
jgi:DivIVA domain-containing protein